MTADDGQLMAAEIRRLFSATVAWPAGDRPAFIAGARELAPDLADEVSDLLRFDADEDAPVPGLPEVQEDRASSAAPRIGNYQPIRMLGSGGQAVVYLARDLRLGRLAALKILTNWSLLSRGTLERFDREAAIMANLDHPSICRVFDAGRHIDTPWIAMEYIEGETLATRLARARGALEHGDSESSQEHAGTEAKRSEDAWAGRGAGSLPGPTEIHKVIELIECVARAVHFAHARGVMHRDLKPGNVMVTTDDRPVVLDFGLACRFDDGSPAVTQTGDVLGTPAYMSPEQISGDRTTIDRRTDVYSLGVVLYECLTHARPFDGATREALFDAVLRTTPPDPRNLNPSITRDLGVVVGMALEKEPARRYQSAEAFADDLRRVRVREPIMARPASAWTKLCRWCQRQPALATASAMGLVLFVVSIALLIQAVSAGNAAQAALGDYERLGDVSRLDQLLREADALWPAEPAKVAAMRKWVERAESLAATLPEHRAFVANLRTTALPISSNDEGEKPTNDSATAARGGDVATRRARTGADLRPLESRWDSGTPGRLRDEAHPASMSGDDEMHAVNDTITQRTSWTFKDRASQFKYDTLARFTNDLASFLDPDPHKGVLADIRQRLSFAATVRYETLDKHAETWRDAVASIGDRKQCPSYDGFRLRPQLGLVPLGKNPQSNLWEFVHLQTAAPGSNPVPARDGAGRLGITEDSGLIFVLLPGGTFKMGAIKPSESASEGSANVDPDAEEAEGPVHDVTLAPFFLSKYEMTQAQWYRLTGRIPSMYKPGTRNGGKLVTWLDPVEQVGYPDCEKWLGRLGLLLPTEAQWEYGCRAQTTGPRWCGADKRSLVRAANVADATCKVGGGLSAWTFETWSDGFAFHAPVGSFAPNGFGLHDTLGNVWEWCRDHYVPYQVDNWRTGDGLRDAGPDAPDYVARGGGFRDAAVYSRSAARIEQFPEQTSHNCGVRPARALDP